MFTDVLSNRLLPRPYLQLQCFGVICTENLLNVNLWLTSSACQVCTCQSFAPMSVHVWFWKQTALWTLLFADDTDIIMPLHCEAVSQSGNSFLTNPTDHALKPQVSGLAAFPVQYLRNPVFPNRWRFPLSPPPPGPRETEGNLWSSGETSYLKLDKAVPCHGLWWHRGRGQCSISHENPPGHRVTQCTGWPRWHASVPVSGAWAMVAWVEQNNPSVQVGWAVLHTGRAVSMGTDYVGNRGRNYTPSPTG